MTGGGGEYERGRVDAILDEHTKHLLRINGSVERTASELHALTLAIQRLADSADADRRTVITTAEALKEAEAARRDKSERGWTPFQRIAVAVASLAAVTGIIFEIVRHLPGRAGQVCRPGKGRDVPGWAVRRVLPGVDRFVRGDEQAGMARAVSEQVVRRAG